MLNRLRLLWKRIHSSFWFVPTLMTASAVAIAIALVSFAPRGEGVRIPIVPSKLDAGGARAIISTIATCVMTVGGVAFSITMVVLTLASSQLGARLVRHFMHDIRTQVALGAFVATFAYCLVVLLAIPGDGGPAEMPTVSVVGGALLAVFDIGVILFFVHHMAISIQAPSVIARLHADLLSGLELATQRGSDRVSNARSTEFARRSETTSPASIEIHATRDGYVQGIGEAAIIRLARDSGCVVRLDVQPGAFVTASQVIGILSDFEAGAASQEDWNEMSQKVAACVAVGAERTLIDDCELAIHQLVELGVRALSPGINDPHSAMMCLDYLGAALRSVDPAELPNGCFQDDEGHLRLLVPALEYPNLIDAAFDEMRRHASGDLAVTERLLMTLERLSEHAALRPVDIEAIDRHIEAIERRLTASGSASDEARTLCEKCAEARANLSRGKSR